ncbi:MAG: hypothetical protein AABY22_04415 [Nanoarchaeota archaeon]
MKEIKFDDIEKFTKEGVDNLGVDIFNQLQMAKLSSGFTALIELCIKNKIINEKEFLEKQKVHLKNILDISFKIKEENNNKEKKSDYIG